MESTAADMHGEGKPNRVTMAFDRMEKQIAQRVKDGLTTAEKVKETHKALNMEWDEYIKFQELKSLAYMNGKLTLDESNTVYQCLGEGGPDKFNKQPVHVKAVLTGLLKELLEMGRKLHG